MGGLTAGRFTAAESGIEQGLAFGNCLGETSAAGGSESFALFLQQFFLVCRVEHLLPAVIGTAVPGNLLGCRRECGPWIPKRRSASWSADGCRRNGVIVQVKADIDGLARPNGDEQIRVEPVCGQGQQTRLFFREGFRHGAVIASRPGAAVSYPVTPFEGLAVEILQGGKRTGGKEGIPDVANNPLDASFLVPGAHLAGTGGEVVMGAQLQKPGMKVDGVAAPLQHYAAEIVVEQDSGNTFPVLKGATWPRRKLSIIWSKKNSKYSPRE